MASRRQHVSGTRKLLEASTARQQECSMEQPLEGSEEQRWSCEELRGSKEHQQECSMELVLEACMALAPTGSEEWPQEGSVLWETESCYKRALRGSEENQ